MSVYHREKQRYKPTCIWDLSFIFKDEGGNANEAG